MSSGTFSLVWRMAKHVLFHERISILLWCDSFAFDVVFCINICTSLFGIDWLPFVIELQCRNEFEWKYHCSLQLKFLYQCQSMISNSFHLFGVRTSLPTTAFTEYHWNGISQSNPINMIECLRRWTIWSICDYAKFRNENPHSEQRFDSKR